MSCLGFLTPGQRAALAASSAAGAPLSSFTSPPASDGKVARLRLLAHDSDPVVRESAALAYHSPPDVLALLARDPVVGVRACVARNPGVPADLLHALARDDEPVVRGWVAANPSVPQVLLDELARDEDEAVRTVSAWAGRWER